MTIIPIGERFDLSDSASITVYYDGGATIIVTHAVITLDAAEVLALRRVL